MAPPAGRLDVWTDNRVDGPRRPRGVSTPTARRPGRATTKEHLMADLHDARRAVDALAADRRSRGKHVPPAHVEAAAALLADLWAVAARHGVGPDHRAWTTYLPRAALDTITAAARP